MFGVSAVVLLVIASGAPLPPSHPGVPVLSIDPPAPGRGPLLSVASSTRTPATLSQVRRNHKRRPPPPSSSSWRGALPVLGAVSSSAIAAAALCSYLDNGVSRRAAVMGFAAPAVAVLVPRADAATVQFPPPRLKNRYFLMRAGLSPLEAKGIIRTNPVIATQISSNGLSREGRRQVIQALEALKAAGLEDEVVWLWPSINARAYETAEILADGLGVGRARLVPEFSFLDARGLGAYEGQPVARVTEIYAKDSLDANNRPPRYTDGTPNESVADVLVRVAQLLSKTETQYSSINIVFISPDSDNLSIMQAALTGVDIRKHWTLAYQPGEVRLVDLTGIQ